MQSEVLSLNFVWGVLPARFQSELTLHKSDISRLCGLSAEYGHGEGNFNREREEKEIIEELTGVLVQAVALAALQMTDSMGRKAGRPREDMIPYLAPALLSVYLRYHRSGGRQSVATSTDGKLRQEEAGPLFEFIEVTIEPLNRYLTADLYRRPLSASRLARFALDERRQVVSAAKPSRITMLERRIEALEKRRLRT